jgi:hypothetical protein
MRISTRALVALNIALVGAVIISRAPRNHDSGFQSTLFPPQARRPKSRVFSFYPRTAPSSLPDRALMGIAVGRAAIREARR